MSDPCLIAWETLVSRIPGTCKLAHSATCCCGREGERRKNQGKSHLIFCGLFIFVLMDIFCCTYKISFFSTLVLVVFVLYKWIVGNMSANQKKNIHVPVDVPSVRLMPLTIYLIMWRSDRCQSYPHQLSRARSGHSGRDPWSRRCVWRTPPRTGSPRWPLRRRAATSPPSAAHNSRGGNQNDVQTVRLEPVLRTATPLLQWPDRLHG